MTTPEFSNEFDILYNNISSNMAPGLNEYEKSILLTRAQETIVAELYNGSGYVGPSFEKTEDVRRYLSNLVLTEKLQHPEESTNIIKTKDYSSLYALPSDSNKTGKVMFIIYERILATKKGSDKPREVKVLPVKHDELHNYLSNPFKGPNASRFLRVDHNGILEIIPDTSSTIINEYIINYIKKPKPIILTDLNDNYPNLTINGISTTTECELDESLHPSILQKAVELAIASYKN